MSRAWKNAEREVAKYFGGLRRVRIAYSESCEDVIHHKYAIEVKYGKQIPKYVMVEKPTLLVNDGLVLIPSWCATEVEVEGIGINREMTFLRKGMEQAAKYNDKLPLLCMKKKGMHGFIMCMWLTDYMESNLAASSMTPAMPGGTRGTISFKSLA